MRNHWGFGCQTWAQYQFWQLKKTSRTYICILLKTEDNCHVGFLVPVFNANCKGVLAIWIVGIWDPTSHKGRGPQQKKALPPKLDKLGPIWPNRIRPNPTSIGGSDWTRLVQNLRLSRYRVCLWNLSWAWVGRKPGPTWKTPNPRFMVGLHNNFQPWLSRGGATVKW